ncbi:MAG: signal peptide peptidase SppA [Planctomycetes bacterium]|nr:signal peptide peptidase SppA [Planctomycetota bacterium]
MPDLPPSAGAPEAPPPRPIPYASPAAPPARTGRPASFWVALFALFLLIGSIGLNLLLALGLSASSMGSFEASVDPRRAPVERFLEGDRDATEKVVVIPVRGILMSGEVSPFMSGLVNIDRLIAQIRHATKDDDVKAIILSIDSPGGSITDCDLIVREIGKLRKERGDIKIVALFNDIAASGGYYIAAPADEIIAHPTTLTGSIGVIMSFLNIGKLASEHGVTEVVIKSAPHKDIGSMWREMDPEEQKILQALVDEMFERFIDVVKSGRGSKITEARLREVADGRIMSGQQAFDVKLIDAVGYFDDAVASARKLAGLSRARVVEYIRPPTLADLLTGEVEARRAASAASAAGEWGGLAGALQGETPRMLYLWKVR